MSCTTRIGVGSRRNFLKTLLAAGAAIELCPLALGEPPAPKQLRVIAYNVLACTGFPADRPLAKAAVAREQMADRMALELALYDPDVINFSESPDESLVKAIAERLKMNQVRFPSGEDWPGSLLSRFPIDEVRNAPVASGKRPEDLFTRHWGQATIQLPGGVSLIVHSAHLYPFRDPAVRLREIGLMIDAMREDLKAGKPMLLMGDLNHTPHGPEYPKWIEAGWVDSFAQAGKGDGFTIGVEKPMARIDYIFSAGPLGKAAIESRPLFEAGFRLHGDDPQDFALSDHLPQLAVFAL